MVQKLPALAVLVATLATPVNVHSANIFPQQQERIRSYSISDIDGLLAKRGEPLYFAAEGELVRVKYSPLSERIMIDTLKDTEAGGELREINLNDPLRAKLNGNFTADISIVCKGKQYGYDNADEYSPLNQPSQQYYKIGIEGKEGKAKFNDYLQKIGKLLK